MEITQTQRGQTLELKLTGRLDAYFADKLMLEVSNAVRAGHRRIALNMSSLTFLSSAGIRIVFKSVRDLRNIGGSLVITEPSVVIQEVLKLTRMDMLIGSVDAPPAPPAPAKNAPRPIAIERADFHGIMFEDTSIRPMQCKVIGDPQAFGRRLFTADDCKKTDFPRRTIGFGIGALGDGFEECKGRFGEFVAAGGALAYQPTDQGNRADYLISSGGLVPSAHVLHAIVVKGDFSVLIQFDSKNEEAVSLVSLAKAAIEATGKETVALAILADTASLVGAAMIKSPALATTPDEPFLFPGIRTWIGFTSERAYPDSTSLVVGVASSNPSQGLKPYLRPMADGVYGHFHAAAFGYRPLRKGDTDITAAMTTLFEEQLLKGVLHLLHDNRPVNGVGDSRLLHGNLWAGGVEG